MPRNWAKGVGSTAGSGHSGVRASVCTGVGIVSSVVRHHTSICILFLLAVDHV